MQKTLSILLAVLLFAGTAFNRPFPAQTQENAAKTAQTKLTREDLFAKFSAPEKQNNFEEEAFKSSLKQNKFSSGAKIAILTGTIAAAVIIIALLATRDDDDEAKGPCGAVTTPCPPGCVCIQ